MKHTGPQQFDSRLTIKRIAFNVLYFFNAIVAYTEQDGIQIHLRRTRSDA